MCDEERQRQVLCRPCERLYPVEMRNVDVVKSVGAGNMDIVEEKVEGGEKRSKRRAAVDAYWKTKAKL